MANPSGYKTVPDTLRMLPDKPSRESLLLVDEAARKIRDADNGLHSWFNNYALQQRARIALDIDIVSKCITKDARIVEFGSMPFLTTIVLHELGYEIRGTDISPERFRKTIDASGIMVDKCDIELEPMPFQDSSFNVALFMEIFEHLRINPINSLREAYRVLKPGGLLFLSTPNLKSLAGLYEYIFRGRTGADPFDEYMKLEEIGHMGHVRLYSAREVCDFLTRIGFSITGIHYRGEYNSRMMSFATGLFPALKPMIMVTAVK